MISELYQKVTQYFKEKRIKSNFYQNCADAGLTPWTPNPDAKSQYPLGVTLNWYPGMPSAKKVIEKEAKLVLSVAKTVAEKFGLEAKVTEPTFSAGGCLAMYVGFSNN